MAGVRLNTADSSANWKVTGLPPAPAGRGMAAVPVPTVRMLRSTGVVEEPAVEVTLRQRSSPGPACWSVLVAREAFWLFSQPTTLAPGKCAWSSPSRLTGRLVSGVVSRRTRSCASRFTLGL